MELTFFFAITILTGFLLFILYDIGIILKPKALKSPKEKYEDMLIERFKAGDYTRDCYSNMFMQWEKVWVFLPNFISKYKKLQEVVERHRIFELQKERERQEKQEEERKRNEEIQKQKEEDELYESKIKELLKIKPLDADLKEDFRKASRRIELSNNMLKRAEENKKDYAELLTIMPKKW